MKKLSEIAAIVPAHNEADRIGSVLNVLNCVERLNEIIVVDDGSADDTIRTVQAAAELDPRIRLLQHASNLGKGQSILTARKATRAPVLLLLDADLGGLKPEHVLALIEPVIRKRAEMTLGLFKGGRFITDLSHWVTPWLTGQRCLRAGILDELDIHAAGGYGFETALTVAAYRRSYRTEIVWLHGVWHPPSELHRGVFPGVWHRIRMYVQILNAWNSAGGWSVLWRRAQKRVLSVL